MKIKTITLILTPLLFMLGLNAKEISSHSTFHQYAKPGAPVDMRYTSQKVDVNEISDVKITLFTSIPTGKISTLIDLDKNLNSLKIFDDNVSFQVMPNQQTFVINLQVRSQKEGLYYIRLLTKVDQGYGVKLRSFAIPIYVGKEPEIINKNINMRMKALSSGENISISKAIETIEVVKEK
ncbi:MAG: Unknown protein [uncultured Sulfurovum sp.]|uniref:Uncharacterized protein n=1 Tax=uncultured Sulfurovum sp. TaxID=269237 RepID=A0A6S6U6W0_9BACT|nr:MAG: Unknown protein [uncultured Sulfurovum sp.]